MAPSDGDVLRESRLKKAFGAFIKGRRLVSGTHDARLFLESARIQPSASRSLEDIHSSEKGLEVVRQSVRASSDAQFLCDYVLPFILYLAESDAKLISDGSLLQQLVATVVEPTTAWNPILRMYNDGGFIHDIGHVRAFAWLCLLVATHPGPQLSAFGDLAPSLDNRPLISSTDPKTKELGYQIQNALRLRASNADSGDPSGPGGRHDNDFADFRRISVYPTNDELESTLLPYFRRAQEIEDLDPERRASGYLDNQFRLLREDMLEELRHDIQVAIGKKTGKKKRIQVLGKLEAEGIETGNTQRSQRCSLLLSVGSGLGILQGQTRKQRVAFLEKNKNFLRHDAFGALCLDQKILGFAFVVRDIDKLADEPPVLELRPSCDETWASVLPHLGLGGRLRFVLVGTSVFAYEPVLERLKTFEQLPLEDQILHLRRREDEQLDDLTLDFELLIRQLRPSQLQEQVRIRLGGRTFSLDQAQARAMIHALDSPLSLIQGPPGTGKSYIGALAAKAFVECSSSRLLVISYTNHALDQFLEDLLDIGIEASCMTRLGSKSTTRTADLSFERQSRGTSILPVHRSRERLGRLKEELNELREKVDDLFSKVSSRPSLIEILDFLEFSEDSTLQKFWAAFHIDTDEDGFRRVGKNRVNIRDDYLIDRWIRGKNAGPLIEAIPADCKEVWSIKPADRRIHVDKWMHALCSEHAETFQETVARYNDTQRKVDAWYNETKCDFIQTKRIIGCTTTAAAKYAPLIKAASPDCVLVEEAGEILEAHITTALSPDTKRLILIGDHQQLRPKCNSYRLSVERGDGYDLNRSMFERLILGGSPYETLLKQHRMVPEISQLVRDMTYPDLMDAAATHERPEILGIRRRVVFINHDHPEAADEAIIDRGDPTQKASKENLFEAEMVLMIVRYLFQQGYTSEQIVILTPYLGQLRRLRDILGKDNDPVLSDMDTRELVQAGLMTGGSAKVNKSRIRLSTIDNYQGEESDIVVASLTRSNKRGDIGFMKASERLNVLISRARNCLIMLGNMDTFLASDKGQSCWPQFFLKMKEMGCLQNGLWVHCEQHPGHSELLLSPQDFDEKCPDGGCNEPCGATLSCGLHTCHRRCHRRTDHNQMACQQLVDKTCERQHKYRVKCDESGRRCSKCCIEDEDLRRRIKRDLQIERDRAERQAEYRREILEIQDEIERQRKLVKYGQEREDQDKHLGSMRAELASLKDASARRSQMKERAKQIEKEKEKHSRAGKANAVEQVREFEAGSPGEEWEQMKREEGAQSSVLDSLMDMIGLDAVKRSFLNIKANIDTAIRQGISTEKDRYGCSLLGNPGTGKTTVARLYAKFLTDVGAVAGSCFKETTGSKLASMGTKGCQDLLNEILNEGGGVLFIDEAYQLSSGNSPGGRAVMDFLLAEVENLNSKVCFILAGYAKQMESFFAHNPGIPSRFPLEMKFEDYTDHELVLLLEHKINAMYGGRMKVEDGMRGLYCRIVARRLGRGRGKEGFGNARAVENTFAIIRRRQSNRLMYERRQKQKPDDLLLTKQDLIGPEPLNALEKSGAWKKLQELVGLDSVKQSIQSLVSSIQENYQRELNEEPLIEYNLNRVFLGNPGTGKTTVAKLYGQILVDLALLSNGEVIVKNPADFVGGALGQSEQQTTGILAATVGKVLVIDEAYGLYGGKSVSDPFKAAVVDTIVSTVQSVPGDDRCVLLLGYRDQMEEMFQNVNPGLSRRFPISSAFNFEDFSQSELATILDLKLAQRGYKITSKAKDVALEVLDRSRNRPNFGNAGEIDILLNEAMSRHQKRLTEGKTKRRTILEASDFDEDYDRLERSETNIDQLFEGTVGCERLVAILKGFQNTVKSMKALGYDPKESIPFNFLFRGPPGTGKTTTARKMAKVFYDAGFLADASVLDCSASDLVAEYVGQTGPKVRQLMDKALGRVLLVDEAYRLAEGHFAKEALDEIVDAVTKEKYHKKLIIILAGYEDDINRLLNSNPGLGSRFPEAVDFFGLGPDDCFELLGKRLGEKKVQLEANGKGHFDIACLQNPSSDFRLGVKSLFKQLSKQPGWANARDVETLAKAIFQHAIESWNGEVGKSIEVSEQRIMAEMSKMADERASRAKQSHSGLAPICEKLAPQSFQDAQIPTQKPSITTSTVKDLAEEVKEEASNDSQTTQSDDGKHPHRQAIRDAGVSDEIWEQLQRDAEAEEQRDLDYQAKLKAKEKVEDDAERERILLELIEEEERKKREAEMKKKLEKSGLCPMGYTWIQQAQGWRCAGGSHFVSASQLGMQ